MQLRYTEYSNSEIPEDSVFFGLMGNARQDYEKDNAKRRPNWKAEEKERLKKDYNEYSILLGNLLAEHNKTIKAYNSLNYTLTRTKNLLDILEKADYASYTEEYDHGNFESSKLEPLMNEKLLISYILKNYGSEKAQKILAVLGGWDDILH